MKPRNGIIPYMDDILIYAESPAKALTVLNYLLKRLQRYNLKVKLSKCQFLVQKVEFLGYEVSAQGITQPLSRTTALTSIKLPTNGAELASFLGALNWISKFLGPRYSQVAAPLLDLKSRAANAAGSMKKTKLRKVQLEWQRESYDAWYNLMDLIAEKCHTMAHPNYTGFSTNIITDASDNFYAGMLTQTKSDQDDVPIQDRDHVPIGFLSGQFKQ